MEVFGSQECTKVLVGTLSRHSPCLTEILEVRRNDLRAQLAEVEEALAAMKANPEVEKIINLVTKVRY